MMYIIPIFYRTTLQWGCDIGPTLHYLKWALVWTITFEGGIIIEHDFISNFVFVVTYFTIFVDFIYINFWLIFLMY